MRFNPFHLCDRAQSFDQWTMRVFCVAAIAGAAMWLGIDLMFALIGIAVTEALRAFNDLSTAFCRYWRRIRDTESRRAAVLRAALAEMLRLAAIEITRMARQIVTIPRVCFALLVATLRVANNDIVHVALSSRLLPAPVPAR